MSSRSSRVRTHHPDTGWLSLRSPTRSQSPVLGPRSAWTRSPREGKASRYRRSVGRDSRSTPAVSVGPCHHLRAPRVVLFRVVAIPTGASGGPPARVPPPGAWQVPNPVALFPESLLKVGQHEVHLRWGVRQRTELAPDHAKERCERDGQRDEADDVRGFGDGVAYRGGGDDDIWDETATFSHRT